VHFGANGIEAGVEDSSSTAAGGMSGVLGAMGWKEYLFRK